MLEGLVLSKQVRYPDLHDQTPMLKTLVLKYSNILHFFSKLLGVASVMPIPWLVAVSLKISFFVVVFLQYSYVVEQFDIGLYSVMKNQDLNL